MSRGGAGRVGPAFPGTESTRPGADSAVAVARSGRGTLVALTVLRCWVGAVWLSNGIAKATGVRRIDLGFFKGSLIDLDVAHGILRGAVDSTPITFLAGVYGWMSGPAWPVFGTLLTGAELLIGLCLVLGLIERPVAVLGILILGPIWVMKWAGGGYLWDYPADLAPLLVIALLPGPVGWGVRSRSRR